VTGLGDLTLAFLLNALWQAAAAAGVAAALGRLLRRAPARHRYALWLAAFLLAALLPWASLLPGVGRADRAPASPSAHAAPDSPGAAADGAAWLPEGRPLPPPAVPEGLAAGLGLAWAGSVLIQTVRLARAWSRTRRLARGARPLALSGDAAAVAARCHAAFGLPPVPLLASVQVSGPVTLGARRPCILLPPGFPAVASPEQLAAALGHEMAHIRRHDYAVHLLCEALFIPVAFHPAARWVRRRLKEAREMACDEAAVERLMSARTFARSLLSMAAAAAGLARPAPTIGALDADTLEVRMKSLTDPRPRLGALPARATLALALLLLTGLGLAGSTLAVQAAAGQDAAWKPFLGVWQGDFPTEDGRKLPGSELEVRMSKGRPEAILTLYRYVKNGDGSVRTDTSNIPAYDLSVQGRTLTFHLRTAIQYREGGRKEIVEHTDQLELAGDGEAVLTWLGGRHSAEPSQIPPPPPPSPMKRLR
jgi:beta-lactamase regulating signal transducer with metallopeptidase domain